MKTSASLLCVLFLYTFLTGFTSYNEGYQVGDKVKDFELKNVDGKMLSMADNESVKGYIVVVTCNTCPVAKVYEDRVISLHEKYKSKGFPVIAINPNDASVSPGDSFEMMKKRAKEKDYSFPYLYDETQEVAKEFGAKSTPTAYILKKKDSEFVLVYKGAIDNNNDVGSVTTKYVEDAMSEILNEKPVTTKSTKAIGCGIKWAKG